MCIAAMDTLEKKVTDMLPKAKEMKNGLDKAIEHKLRNPAGITCKIFYLLNPSSHLQ